MKTTAAPLPWIYRKVSKRFVCFVTYLGEIAKTDALFPEPILKILRMTYEEYKLVARWMITPVPETFPLVPPKALSSAPRAGARERRKKNE